MGSEICSDPRMFMVKNEDDMNWFYQTKIHEPQHEISNKVAFDKCRLRRLCSLLVSLETPNDVRSVA